MIKVIIVDDDELCREALKDSLQSFKKIKVIKEFSSADEALTEIPLLHPDLVFLDVEMPGKSGIELLNEIENICFETIFTTSHPHYAIPALKADALDYLLKPVQELELAEALHKFALKRNQNSFSKQMQDFIGEQRKAGTTQKKISVPTTNGLEFIRINDIIRLQSDINYTSIHLSDGRKIIIPKTLKEYEVILKPYDFVRIHNSHIINLNYLKRYIRGNGGIVHLDDGTELDVSRLRKDELLLALKNLEK
jgi:two-component system, LytTR family, response regulator